MTLSKSLITGHLNDATQIRFTLSAWDSELAEIVLSQSQTFDLVDGDLPDTCEIWQNQAGLRGTSYTVTAINRGGDGFPAREELGIIQVGTASSYVLADLLEASGSITPGNTYTVLTEAERAQLVTMTGLQILTNKALALPTRVAFIALNNAGAFADMQNGWVVEADGRGYRRVAASTVISDLHGWVPHGDLSILQFASETVLSADAQPAINAMLTYAATLVEDAGLTLSRNGFSGKVKA